MRRRKAPNDVLLGAMVSKFREGAARGGALLALALLLSACPHFTPPVDPEEPPQPGDAFVYGGFKLGATQGESIGLTLTCSDGNQYCLRFDGSTPLQAIKVAPSTCWATSVAFVDIRGEVVARKTFDRGLLDNMRFEAGKAYYIGDFWGTISWRDSSTFGQDKITTRWKVQDLHDYYQNATTSLFIHYPNLSRVPTVDQLRLSAPSLPPESEP
jgi:hypothetical protein